MYMAQFRSYTIDWTRNEYGFGEVFAELVQLSNPSNVNVVKLSFTFDENYKICCAFATLCIAMR